MNKYKRLLILLCAITNLKKGDLPLQCKNDIIPILKRTIRDEITVIEIINKTKDKK